MGLWVKDALRYLQLRSDTSGMLLDHFQLTLLSSLESLRSGFGYMHMYMFVCIVSPIFTTRLNTRANSITLSIS